MLIKCIPDIQISKRWSEMTVMYTSELKTLTLGHSSHRAGIVLSAPCAQAAAHGVRCYHGGRVEARRAVGHPEWEPSAPRRPCTHTCPSKLCAGHWSASSLSSSFQPAEAFHTDSVTLTNGVQWLHRKNDWFSLWHEVCLTALSAASSTTSDGGFLVATPRNGVDRVCASAADPVTAAHGEHYG